MARLSAIAMQDPLFRKIITTRYYSCQSREAVKVQVKEREKGKENLAAGGGGNEPRPKTNDRKSTKLKNRVFNWRNSNKLLSKGFNGLKTGNTPAAGPCLATSLERKDIHLIVVVLNAKTMKSRWNDSCKLTLWAMNRIEKMLQHFSPESFRLKPKGFNSTNLTSVTLKDK
jgi:hypothetical protein